MIHFGTGGWREIIGDKFTRDNIHRVAHALSSMKEVKKVVIGYDRRFLSKEACFWFIEALASHNIKSLFIDGSSPTPLIMFATKLMGADFGVAVTASHNPAIYNGIKIFTSDGNDAPLETTDRLSELANNISEEELKNTRNFYEIEHSDLFEKIHPFNDYIDSILNSLNVDAIRNAHLRIAIDPMYGVSESALITLLSSVRCETTIINGQHDTLFGGRLPSPASASLHKLMDLVLQKQYNLGVATDGDADRIGIIDELGNFIHPNTLLCLLYYYLLEFKHWKGAVVRNIATTHMLDKIAEKYGEKCIETNVGFKYISENMRKYDAIIGGESSGGLTVKGHIGGKDGIYAAALLIEMICVTKKSIHTLAKELEEMFGTFYFSENDYRFTPEKKAKLVKMLFEEEKIPAYENIERAYYADGLKVLFKDGSWIIARFSGTEPVLRIFAEAGSHAKTDEYVKMMEDLLDIKEDEKI